MAVRNPEVEGDAAAVWEPTTLGLEGGDADSEGLLESDAYPDALPCSDADGEAEGLPLGEVELLTLGDADTLGDPEALTRITLGVAASVLLALPQGEAEAEGAPEALTLLELVPVGVAVELSVGVVVAVDVGRAERVALPEDIAVAVLEAVGSGLPDTETLL